MNLLLVTFDELFKAIEEPQSTTAFCPATTPEGVVVSYL